MLKGKDVMALSRDSEKSHHFLLHPLECVFCTGNHTMSSKQARRQTHWDSGGNEAGILWEKLKIKCKMKDYEHLKDKQRGDHIRPTAGLQSMTH